MSTRISTNTAVNYSMAILVIVILFLLLGGWSWILGMMHGNRFIGVPNWNWTQIIICLGVGFLLGMLASRKK
jgi:hypothetical protein